MCKLKTIVSIEDFQLENEKFDVIGVQIKNPMVNKTVFIKNDKKSFQPDLQLNYDESLLKENILPAIKNNINKYEEVELILNNNLALNSYFSDKLSNEALKEELNKFVKTYQCKLIGENHVVTGNEDRSLDFLKLDKLEEKNQYSVVKYEKEFTEECMIKSVVEPNTGLILSICYLLKLNKSFYSINKLVNQETNLVEKLIEKLKEYHGGKIKILFHCNEKTANMLNKKMFGKHRFINVVSKDFTDGLPFDYSIKNLSDAKKHGLLLNPEMLNRILIEKKAVDSIEEDHFVISENIKKGIYLQCFPTFGKVNINAYSVKEKRSELIQVNGERFFATLLQVINSFSCEENTPIFISLPSEYKNMFQKNKKGSWDLKQKIKSEEMKIVSKFKINIIKNNVFEENLSEEELNNEKSFNYLVNDINEIRKIQAEDYAKLEREIYLYVLKKENSFYFSGKMFLKGSPIRSKFYRSPKKLKTLKLIIDDLKNEAENVKIYIDFSLFNDEEKKLKADEKGKYVYIGQDENLDFINNFNFYHVNENVILSKFTEEENSKIKNCEKFSLLDGQVDLSKEEYEEKLKKEKLEKELEEQEKNRKDKIKQINIKLQSYNMKKSVHNKIFFYIDTKTDDNVAYVHATSDVLSKKGNTRVVNYEGMSIVSKSQLEEHFLKTLKNPIKSANKNRVVEIVVVFKSVLDVRKYKNIIDETNIKLLDDGKFLFSVKNENQVSQDVMCLMYHDSKKFEKEDDKREFVVNEDETKDDTLCIYSDACFIENMNKKEFTYGLIFKYKNSDIAWKQFLGKGYSIYTTSADSCELNGIVGALRKVRELKQDGSLDLEQKVEIRCDCLNAVRFLNNGLDKDKLHEKEMLNHVNELEIIKIQYLLKQEELLGLVDFKWLKGHSNEEFNEKADMLAKKAYSLIKDVNTIIEF